jgi:hypothetical protein
MTLKGVLANGFLMFLLATNALHGGVSKLLDGLPILFAPPEKPAPEVQVSIPPSKLLEAGIPRGLVLFQVGIDSSRLAVLSGGMLKIYRPEGSVLVQEFSLSKREEEEWGELEVFPSQWSPFGVVLYKTGDYSRSGAQVICWVKGHWETVFEGSYVDFVDIDLDGVPEIFTEERKQDTGPPDWVHVWVWDGSRYVDVERIRFQKLYATDVIQRIKAVRKQKH